MTSKRPIFAIFEGGGARGIAHIGALEAVEANDLAFVGVAGASAGAIVATLVAVGLRPSQILNPDAKGVHILAHHDLTTTKVLGEEAWASFNKLRRGGPRAGKGLVAGGIGVSALLSLSAVRVALSIYEELGHFSTAGFRELVNTILKNRLLDMYAAQGRPRASVPARVLFKHLDYETFPEMRPLKIVATDLGRRALTVFDRSLTPDVEVAEAVAASIAIPLVFKPVVITSYADKGAGPFVDGGLISNSPTWVFAEEKLAFERNNPKQPPVPIVSFTLVDKTRPNDEAVAAAGALSMPAFLTTFVRTAIFGSQAVSQRFIEDLLVVPLETELGVLDFDAEWQKVRDAYIDGRRSAAEHLKFSLTVKPDVVQSELEKAHDQIRALIDRARSEQGIPLLVNSRANIIERFGSNSFRVTGAYNMQDDPDDRLLLDGRGPGAPRAFWTRAPLVVQLAGDNPEAGRVLMTKYERALVRPSLRSAICVPIFTDVKVWGLKIEDRPEPLGVFCFDSDDDLALDFERRDLQDLLAERSNVLSSTL